MFSPRIIFWGGLAGVICGLFWMIIVLTTDSSAVPIALAFVLALGGVAGLYSQQAGQGGRLGLAGFFLGIIGTGLALAALWWGNTSGRFSMPTITRSPTLVAPPFLILSLGMFILGVGIVLLGVASLRGNALHRWRGLPLGLGLLNTLGGMMFWLVYYMPLSQGRDAWDQWSLIGGYVVYHAVTGLRCLSALLGVGWMGLGIMLATEANAQVVQPHEASAETR